MIAVTPNTLADYAQVVLAIGVIVGGLGWIAKHFKDTILSEIKPNGGNTNSLGDVVSRVETHLERQTSMLADHLEHDKAFRESAGQALVDGQKELLDTIAKVAAKQP